MWAAIIEVMNMKDVAIVAEDMTLDLYYIL